MSAFTKRQSVYMLKSFMTESFLQLEDNGTISATRANVFSFEDPRVHFNVITSPDLVANVLQYQFKPYNKVEKFLAIVDGEVSLKGEDECSAAQRSFYRTFENADYSSFYVMVEDVIHYLGCDKEGKLYTSSTPLEESSWFHMLPLEERTGIIVTEEAFMFGNNIVDIITEVAVAEE